MARITPCHSEHSFESRFPKLNNKTETNISRIPITLKNETCSFHNKKPIKVATKGSTVTKIAALPVSKPCKPIV